MANAVSSMKSRVFIALGPCYELTWSCTTVCEELEHRLQIGAGMTEQYVVDVGEHGFSLCRVDPDCSQSPLVAGITWLWPCEQTVLRPVLPCR